MKPSSLIAVLVLASFAAAAPAVAKTSIAKGKQICETAAKSADPAPKSVRTDKDATRVSDDTIVYTLRVKNADDSSTRLACTLDRESAQATLSPAS